MNQLCLPDEWSSISSFKCLSIRMFLTAPLFPDALAIYPGFIPSLGLHKLVSSQFQIGDHVRHYIWKPLPMKLKYKCPLFKILLLKAQ